MISLDRNSVDAPASLTDPNGAGAHELANARAHYATSTEAFNFIAYKGDDVRLALAALSHVKCAYCEAKYGATSPSDIEHYRPKSSVAGEPEHRGYWWLAASWNNLLPSCIECNRHRDQVIVTPGMSLEEAQRLLRTSAEILTGKHDSFPILGVRALGETSDLILEDPLLLDPTTSDPNDHLFFAADISVSIVAPKPYQGSPSSFGSASIQTHGLNRLGLVQARTELWLNLELIRIDIRDFLKNVDEALTEAERQKWFDSALRKFERLEQLAGPKEQFSALAKAYLLRVEREMGIPRQPA